MFRQRLLELLRVPPAPTPPAGDRQANIFRAAPSYFHYRVLVWGLSQLGALIGILVGLFVFSRRIPAFGPMPTIFSMMEFAALAAFPIQLLASAALLRLDFEQRWYIVSERSLRIREGLVRMHEKTMTFANVQHVGIRQNPIQRWLGISDVEVRTAGGAVADHDKHGADKDSHVGFLRGVDNAELIRDVIRERLRRHADAGLGDPDDRAPSVQGQAGSADLVAAAMALREEARTLRIAAAARQ